MSEKPTYEELEQVVEKLKKILSHLQTTLDSTADGVLVVDRNGKIVFFSKQFAKMWKIPESVLKSKDDDEALAFVLDQLKDPEGFLSKVKELYAHPEAESFDTLEFKDHRIFERYSRPRILKNEIIGRVWSFRDVTELKRSEKMLKDSENKFKSFAEQSLVGVNLIQDGVFKYVNPKFAEMFGYTVEECLDDMHFRKLVYPEDLPIVEEQVKKRVEGEVKSVQYTFRGLKKSGEIINVEIYGSTILIEDQPFVIATILDITKRKKIELELEQAKKEALEMASKDALTGLLNRRAFMERMEQETQRSLRAGSPLSFILIDIDHFKDVNDRYGHQVGDLVLKRFSNQLMKSIRPYDLLGRYGGEEFVICLLGADGLQAVSIAEKIRQQIEEMIIILPDNLQSVRITASFGTAEYETESRENVELLIKRADDALYRAKKEGRNHVCNAEKR